MCIYMYNTVDGLVFMEGLIHELQYPRNSDFLYELWSKLP